MESNMKKVLISILLVFCTISTAAFATTEINGTRIITDRIIIGSSSLDAKSIVNQTEDKVSLRITSNATTSSKYGIEVSTGNGASPATFYIDSNNKFTVLNENSTSGLIWAYRNNAAGATSGPVAFIEQDNSADDQNALTIQNDGSGFGLELDHNNAINYVLYGHNDGVGSVKSRFAFGSNSGGSAGSNYFIRDLNSTETSSPVVYLQNANSDDDQDVLSIRQDGTADSVGIIQNGNGNAINIGSQSTTATTMVITADSQTTASVLRVSTNSGSFSSSDGVFFVRIDNTSATGIAQKIQNDGSGKAQFIDQNGDGVALDIDSEATTAGSFGLQVTANQGAYPALIQYDGNDMYRKQTPQAASSHYFYRNRDSTVTGGPVVLIEQDETNDDQPAQTIKQDNGTAPYQQIIQNGNTCNLIVDADGICDLGTALAVNNSVAMCMVCS